jgi:hypothetical protein
MLISRPTKFGAGITLGGDYLDLTSLHETIHKLAAEDGPLATHHYEFVLGLAYDVRKSYEGQREKWAEGEPIYSGYTAVDILWPNFLVQLGMLRSACAYAPTDRRIQATLYALENCAESALFELDPAVGALCMRWLAQFTRLTDNFLLEFVVHQNKDYLFGAAAGKARIRRLPRLLDDISPFSSAYQDFERSIKKQAEAANAKPQDMGDWSEWPEFKW